MGFDLTSDSGAELRYGGLAWALLLQVAESYGWGPLGTEPPEGVTADTWGKEYDSNEGQYVTAVDAFAMSNALARAIADPDLERRQVTIRHEIDRTIHAMEVAAFGAAEVGPYVADPNPDVLPVSMLRDFVAFLSGGGFRIE